MILINVPPGPKQGVVSMFKFGQNFGMWQMAIAAMSWPYELVTPIRWRKILDSSLPKKPTKEDLRYYAMRRFPNDSHLLARKKDDGRAEAIMIALYARAKQQSLQARM